MPDLRVFTFGPDWGLPSTGPFAVKLLAWLQLAKLPYRHVIQNNPGKGPTGKSPWAEIDGRPVGDSRRIIELLEGNTHLDLDGSLSAADRAEGRAWTRAFEEGFHQILEWELFVHPAGIAYIKRAVNAATPPLVGAIVAPMMCRKMVRQLHARGIGRFAPAEVARIGCEDVDALAARVGTRPYLLGDRLTSADLAVFGQVAPMALWPMATPVAAHIKAQPVVISWVARMREACFPPGAVGVAGAPKAG